MGTNPYPHSRFARTVIPMRCNSGTQSKSRPARGAAVFPPAT